jgi:tRNA(His) guanylyltransferase
MRSIANELPLWHKRGLGLYWKTYEKPAHNPKTGEPVTAVRQRLQVEYELPMKERYGTFIAALLAGAS